MFLGDCAGGGGEEPTAKEGSIRNDSNTIICIIVFYDMIADLGFALVIPWKSRAK